MTDKKKLNILILEDDKVPTLVSLDSLVRAGKHKALVMPGPVMRKMEEGNNGLACLLDTNLDIKQNAIKLHRLLVAATLCVNHSKWEANVHIEDRECEEAEILACLKFCVHWSLDQLAAMDVKPEDIDDIMVAGIETAQQFVDCPCMKKRLTEAVFNKLASDELKPTQPTASA